MPDFVLALDQGTTQTTVILFNENSEIVSRASREFKQYYPSPGWVEHDAEEILKVSLECIRQACQNGSVNPSSIAAIGITNQRETVVVWDKTTGKPVCHAIVWQCRRTAPRCEKLKSSKSTAKAIQRKTGLVVDAYFSASKIQWVLENVTGAKASAKAGKLLCGTIDTWLLWNLTGGKVHATDFSNASRTMLLNIDKGEWDKDLLKLFGVQPSMLPAVFPSSGVMGLTSRLSVLPDGIPVAGIAGDQQAALFGQACFTPGMVKNTYGTGCFLLMHTGKKRVASKNNLLTTIAWGLGETIEYALEGSVFIGGAVVQWLRDGLKMISHAPETETLARSVSGNDGVYFVPAFVGLGAPYWDSSARGTLTGITRGTTKEHIARAALEAIAYQTKDVVECMKQDSGLPLKELRVDGGAAANDFLMQFQSDILPATVLRPQVQETTALGAAYLAGLGVGFWKSRKDIEKNWKLQKHFSPKMNKKERDFLYAGWKYSVKKARAT